MSEYPFSSKRQVPYLIEDPERIPVRRYYDEEFYQAEIEHLWPHVWQMACRVEQIPNVGDWIEYENVGRSVLVLRTNDGVKAFHNACRHRGVPVAGGSGHSHGNCAKSGFVCPFHGWRWNMDGENTLVYGKHLFNERQLDPADINLIPCRAEEWGGSVWINHDDNAPTVKEALGPVAERLEAHNMDQLRAEWAFATVLPANWKIAMEAFMEGYHVATTHPQLHQTLKGLYLDNYAPEREISGSTSENVRKGAMPGVTARQAVKGQFEHLKRLGEGMAGMVHAKELEIAAGLLDMDLADDPDQAVARWYGVVMTQITQQLRARGEPVPDLIEVAQTAPLKAVEFLFPHYFVLPLFTSMAAYRIRPLGPESCFFELWSLTFYPKGEEPEPIMEPTILPYNSQEFPMIPRQDYSNIPIQQKGIHATGFEFMRLAQHVEGLISNYHQVIDGYLRGAPADKLVNAQNCLGGGFDGPIYNLWQ